ncbi:uncharacterized protein LOC121180820 isoform X4 [Toxotes jaculatrix]|uniref:uncharacterized protein LOC121180820 isoform X4 n=1 Tax=Toxotes jaculatrix TaxID=941984 RepID=UPI001B3B0CA4|nr:uncharacterized protein LOC121180820 isoform X4 [Toxotes jaculatrix]
MDGQQIFLFVLLGLASCSHDWISGSVSEMTFGAGDNITLYCDCKSSTGVYIVWYRNCSHVNQPSLVLKTMLQPDAWKHKTEADILNPLPRFHLVWNSSSESYDLQIMNITDLDEGLYYCGTEQSRLETLTPHYVYQYGNTTRILITKGPKASRERLDNRDQTRGNKDEDVCYAALEIRQASQRSKKKETQSSDVATYSAINTCQM